MTILVIAVVAAATVGAVGVTTTQKADAAAVAPKVVVKAWYKDVYVPHNAYTPQPKAGNKYVQFYVVVSNVNDPNEQIGNPYFFTLFDSKNVGHSPATPTFAEGGIKNIMKSQRGDATAGLLVFEINKNVKPAKLIYDDAKNYIVLKLKV